MEWIKKNPKSVIAIVALIGGTVLVATGAITWEDFMSLFERVQPPIEGGG